jgi:hypothetical protein
VCWCCVLVFGAGVMIDEKARTGKCENAILTCYVTTKSNTMLIDRAKRALISVKKHD